MSYQFVNSADKTEHSKKMTKIWRATHELSDLIEKKNNIRFLKIDEKKKIELEEKIDRMIKKIKEENNLVGYEYFNLTER